MNAPEVRIISAGTALPGPPVDNATLVRRFNMPAHSVQWIDAFVGTRTRHFAVDLESGDVCYSVADLGETAARRALTAAGIEPADVDLIVMGTASPDMLMPATVNLIADRLRIDGVPTYQLLSGCTGAFQALDVAHQMMLSGRHRTALVIGADSCAKHLDLGIDVSSLAPGEQVNGVLFGDGAGAMVLSTRPLPGPVIRRVFVELAGLNRPPGQVVEWFGRADRDSGRRPVVEDYKAIEESVPKMAAEAFQYLLGSLGWASADVDYVLPPQLSGRMTERIAESLAVPGAREITCVAETGNTGNALPFFQIERLLSQMVPGDRAVAVAVESSKWVKAGFAAEKA